MIRIANPEHIGAALADMRLMAKLSRHKVADTAGMPQSQYGQYELGRKVPSLPNLLRLLAVYGYDIALIPQDDT